MRSRSGFTLIELLVVLAILGAVSTLIAPLGIKQLEKYKAKAEWQDATRFLEDSRKLAYLTGSPLIIKLEGKKLSRFSQTKQSDVTVDYEHVFFQPQVLRFDANGGVSPEEIEGLVMQVQQFYRFFDEYKT